MTSYGQNYSTPRADFPSTERQTGFLYAARRSFKGRVIKICAAEFCRFLVTVATKGRRRPQCRAVPCRADLSL